MHISSKHPGYSWPGFIIIYNATLTIADSNESFHWQKLIVMLLQC